MTTLSHLVASHVCIVGFVPFQTGTSTASFDFQHDKTYQANNNQQQHHPV
jgi:hypothetical protein